MTAQPTVIKFFAPVIDATINALMQAVDQKLAAGQHSFTILVSSPGGSVFHGLSAYNYLKGLPAEISTHNFGSVDSIGVVLYCAGRKRLCVPQARFLLHGVSAGFPQGANLEEKQLEERLKGLQDRHREHCESCGSEHREIRWRRYASDARSHNTQP